MAQSRARAVADPAEEGGVRPARRAVQRPAEDEAAQTAALGARSVALARYFHGKVETVPAVPIRSLEDFSLWYTPGIAEVSRAIARDPEASFDLTGRWNTIAIVTDGSRVLGLGGLGPEAALPVMEGKALLFRYLGGVNAVPLPVRGRTAEDLVEVVERLAPAFGGVNLEDIASPKCFAVTESLSGRLGIPVWHDDQMGTAAATVAGLLNALQLTGRSVRELRTVFLGAGAANLAAARLLLRLGHDPHRLTLVDQRGVLHAERDDMDELMLRNPWKYRVALATNGGGRIGGPAEALAGADVLVAASAPGPGTVRREWVGAMAPRPIVFALANPVPEIWPEEAYAAGAAVVATGRSDFPNQVNNSLIFPAVFRGVLDARARSIPDEVVLAAARELAARAAERGLTPQHLLPRMDEREVFPHVAAAVAEASVRAGVARVRAKREAFFELARNRIERSARMVRTLLRSGALPPMPRPRRRT